MRDWLRVALALTGLGWGANQFASLLAVYRVEDGVSHELVTGMFATYVAGLAPALLVFAWLSQHVGKRTVIRPALLLSVVSTVLLILGSETSWLLFAGRLTAGLAIGAAMGAGTAWLKELSADAPAGTGARRATIALSSGFALGPLVAGAIAHWLPYPQVLPYVVHLVGMLGVVALAWNTPEADRSDHPTPTIRQVLAHLDAPWFWHVLLPSAPWVFAAGTASFVIAPSLLAGDWSGSPLLVGIGAGVTLGTGVFVQPSIRRFGAGRPTAVLPLGMALTAVGLAMVTAIAVTGVAWLLLPVWLVLGAAYGTVLVGGLGLVERRTPMALMAPSNAVFYVLTYIGFIAPYWVALLTAWFSAAQVLGAGALLAAIICVSSTLRRRAMLPPRDDPDGLPSDLGQANSSTSGTTSAIES